MDTIAVTAGTGQRWRRLAAVLQFLEHLIGVADAPTLIREIVHAVAIWQDGDARVYRRDAAGDYVLHTSLPGANIPERVRRVRASAIGSPSFGVCPTAGGLFGDTQSGSVYLVPLAVSADPEWLLVICGPLETVDDAVMAVVGRVAGLRLLVLQGEWRRALRDRIAETLQVDGRTIDVASLDALATIVAESGGATGALWVDGEPGPRCLASIGGRPAVRTELPATAQCGAARCGTPLSLGPAASAWLEVAAGDDRALRPDAAAVLAEAARVIQPWLAGLDLAARQAAPHGSPDVQLFVERFNEELARARRFDLRLALLHVEIADAAAEESRVVRRLQDDLRQELRGTDVIGRPDVHQVAALLIESDAEGATVAARLRHRLAETARSFNVGTIRIGYAVMSPSCQTADALIEQARRQAEPVST